LGFNVLLWSDPRRGAIQHKISQLDLDFWDYGVGRWERALGLLDSNEFPGWLEDAGIEN
jgi:hypothetical protein